MTIKGVTLYRFDLLFALSMAAGSFSFGVMTHPHFLLRALIIEAIIAGALSGVYCIILRQYLIRNRDHKGLP